MAGTGVYFNNALINGTGGYYVHSLDFGSERSWRYGAIASSYCNGSSFWDGNSAAFLGTHNGGNSPTVLTDSLPIWFI